MSEDMAHFLGWWPHCHPGTEALWGALSKARRGHGATLTLRAVFSVVSLTGIGQPWLPDTSCLSHLEPRERNWSVEP